MPEIAPGRLSFWLRSVEESLSPRRALEGDERADVAIVGAGYAGLWTAYYLKQLDPAMDVAVIEAEIAGRGAAGRNGGWCSLDLANFAGLLRHPETQSRAIELMPNLIDSVYTVGDVVEKEKIACDFHRGGMAHVAISRPQLDRARKAHGLLDGLGLGAVEHWLEPAEMDRKVKIAGGLGGAFCEHCAVVHPAKLARGLADVIERQGVKVFERSPATSVTSGRVVTRSGTVVADTVILATEGYTEAHAGGLPARRLLPMHSFMTVTEPLEESVFEQIGLADREAFGDYSWLVTYGQRTADNRLAFGYGGRTYPDGKPRDVFRAGDRHFRLIQRKLEQQFPVLEGTRYEQSWGGAMGMSRDMTPFVEFDPGTSTGWLGGFFGNGVAATNLAGRAMADLVLGRASDLTGLGLLVRRTDRPFDRRARWEWQPLVWSGVAGTLRSLRRRDRQETGV
jgi:glycine/D-amino acid oxidase-like deaminating enzyme